MQGSMITGKNQFKKRDLSENKNIASNSNYDFHENQLNLTVKDRRAQSKNEKYEENTQLFVAPNQIKNRQQPITPVNIKGHSKNEALNLRPLSATQRRLLEENQVNQGLR